MKSQRKIVVSHKHKAWMFWCLPNEGAFFLSNTWSMRKTFGPIKT